MIDADDNRHPSVNAARRLDLLRRVDDTGFVKMQNKNSNSYKLAVTKKLSWECNERTHSQTLTQLHATPPRAWHLSNKTRSEVPRQKKRPAPSWFSFKILWKATCEQKLCHCPPCRRNDATAVGCVASYLPSESGEPGWRSYYNGRSLTGRMGVL